MIRLYARDDNRLATLGDAAPMSLPAERLAAVAWFDLVEPTPEEGRFVARRLGVAIPTREEMEEIEPSARLYSEDGAEFMTVTAVTNIDTDEPMKTPVTFILKGSTLVTVRYAEPRPFVIFAARAQRPGATPCGTGELAMLGLIEAMIDRIADALERVGNEVDGLSHAIFRSKGGTAKRKSADLQSVIEQIGRRGELLTMARESLVSVNRLLTYHAAVDAGDRKAGKDARQKAKVLLRDTVSLGDHAGFLSGKINFLLDATLGLINLEQNQIIKIFSVAAVVFLPPTLVASIYGMNFEAMPELKWALGYPWAIGLMVVSAIMPYLYFKRRGWL
ncbi:MAG: magnesium transporter CorA family protein [Alphaproteobacteria bacterium]|nr:magnesium transporter CorA family protein [Alphaproteobacteria bacterium]